MLRPGVLRARVDTHIRFKVTDVSEEIWALCRDALTVPNLEKEQALAEHVRGASDMPDTLNLWRVEGGEAILPRGFGTKLKRGMAKWGVAIEYEDSRISVPIYTRGWKSPDLSTRPYQERAVKQALRVQQGVLKAPPGAGKTVTVLETIRRAGERSLVVVNNTHIARQWAARADEHLGVEIGVLGDGDFDVRDITVALVQTLWSRHEELAQQGFWDLFGLICLDECHHLPAYTFSDVLSRSPAKYRLGASATPELQGQMGLVTATLGEVLDDVTDDELVEAGVLVRPSVRVVETGFTFPFFPTHRHGGLLGQPCPVTNCYRNSHSGLHRNNYTELIEELVRDHERNELIAECIAAELRSGHACVVVSDRLEHLDELKALVESYEGASGKCFHLTGRQDSSERMDLYDRAGEGDVVLFSTVANEAMDIPRLDRMFLTYPGANPLVTVQRVGRIMRACEGKEDAIVYDFADTKVGVLRGQYNKRARGAYRAKHMEIAAWDPRGA